jgi:putative two-component system response regulator
MQSFLNNAMTGARILIVDDEESSVRLMEHILGAAGFTDFSSTTDPREAEGICWSTEPDLLLLDLQMRGYDGFEVMAQLAQTLPAQSYLPILVLTADADPETKKKALAAGANDFLSKPLDSVEVVLRINNLLQTRWLHQQLRAQNEALELKVQERTRQLADAQLEILQRLAVAAEYRDDATGQHTYRVGQLAVMIAKGLGQSQEQLEVLRLAATLHDVGKIGVPDHVLMKPGRLTVEEFEIIKLHTNIGAEILGGSNFTILQLAREIALSHHERWNGTGYPNGLKGTEIPLSGRIVALADVFDALTHDRPYKRAWRLDEAIAEIKRLSGLQFDPQLVSILLHLIDNKDLQHLADHVGHSRITQPVASVA